MSAAEAALFATLCCGNGADEEPPLFQTHPSNAVRACPTPLPSEGTSVSLLILKPEPAAESPEAY